MRSIVISASVLWMINFSSTLTDAAVDVPAVLSLLRDEITCLRDEITCRQKEIHRRFRERYQGKRNHPAVTPLLPPPPPLPTITEETTELGETENDSNFTQFK